MTLEFRNLWISKVLNTSTSRPIPISFKVMYISLRYIYIVWKKFCSKWVWLLVWGEQKIFPNKCACFFFLIGGTSQKYKKRNNNPLLPKSTLKYLVCYHLFWGEVWHLQDQCISIWALMQIWQYKLSFFKYVFWQNINFSI